MGVAFRPLDDAPGNGFGAEVVGVDAALRVDEATFRAIEAGWYRHSILLFRGPKTTSPSPAASARCTS
jgi:alpha-ketoglutarate-dependent taurine dioxygenase